MSGQQVREPPFTVAKATGTTGQAFESSLAVAAAQI
jgi:hypothetical protein